MKDYYRIAEMLFPDILKTPEYYFSKYKKRNLPSGSEVTRIAPSPTGYFHLGSLYGAIIDKLTALNTNGIFYFRLEDTDQKREVKEAGNIAYEALQYFEMTPDEGYIGDAGELGEYGPYIQSKRKDIYKAFAKYLVSIGRAYPCFCDKAEDKAEILERREKELEEGNLVEHDKCRDLSMEEIEYNLAKGKPFAIRLLSMGDPNKSMQIRDEIKGDREIRENGKDIVILKSDGIPPYSLAHLVDDTLMGTTIVVRGEEWYQSLASHLELFDAFGYPRLKYAHTPVICKLDNGNKRKLSKRKDVEADSRVFRIMGYPREAVVEYLISLANSDFEEWRMANPTLPYTSFPFSINKIGSNNPMFDIAKLNDISKNIIARFTAEEVYDRVYNWAKEYNIPFANILERDKDFAIKVFSIDRGGDKPRKDIAKWEDVPEYYNYMFKEYSELNIDFTQFDVDYLTIQKIMDDYVSTFDVHADKDTWFNNVKALANKYNFCTDNKIYKQNPALFNGNTATFCNILRVAITGKTNTPDLYSICVCLGKHRLDDIARSI
ncbi:MAG: glutamate--tRNA ligase [Clostridiales bacterium]|nr:glutamate--tRNA ligase [Clostridiales bacterium]